MAYWFRLVFEIIGFTKIVVAVCCTMDSHVHKDWYHLFPFRYRHGIKHTESNLNERYNLTFSEWTHYWRGKKKSLEILKKFTKRRYSLLREGEKTSPLKRISGWTWEYDLRAVLKRAAPPTGSLSVDSTLYTSLKCRMVIVFSSLIVVRIVSCGIKSLGSTFEQNFC